MMNWPEYKFTRGSYTCPLVGQYTTLLAAAAPPELDGRLVFAGEHTSGEFSGFMNGAVQSGNRAAKEIIEPKKEELAEGVIGRFQNPNPPSEELRGGLPVLVWVSQE